MIGAVAAGILPGGASTELAQTRSECSDNVAVVYPAD